MCFLHPGKGDMPQVTNFAFDRYFLHFLTARVMQLQKVRRTVQGNRSGTKHSWSTAPVYGTDREKPR